MVADKQVQRLFKLRASGDTLISAATKTGMSERTARRYVTLGRLPSEVRKQHNWRTRENPFSEVWHEIEAMLAKKPIVVTTKLFADIQERHPGQFAQGQIRTLQRRLQAKCTQGPFTQESFLLMHKLLQGNFDYIELESQLQGKLNQNDLSLLITCILGKSLRYRNRAIAVISHFLDIPNCNIAKFLFISSRTINSYIQQYNTVGAKGLLDFSRKNVKKFEEQKYKDELFRILHAPPSSYDINRTTWRMGDLHRLMDEKGYPIALGNIRRIIRYAGYRFHKARKALTSNDPDYNKKLQEITNILSNLGPKEKFFSIDEFGPFAVKMQGGSSLTLKNQPKIIPQYQVSKGCLIVTAALELSSNQVTHFYSKKKNTDEMIKLLEVLLKEYVGEEFIYFSWDAASWHGSQKFDKKVEEYNELEYRQQYFTPMIKLAPLPSGAQFLNVIESVFSGMARAIIHNSNYQSLVDCKWAIDRYFAERNAYFKEHRKRAGNKIWGTELVTAQFRDSNNCKDPRWR